jgi:hypothetical protein
MDKMAIFFEQLLEHYEPIIIEKSITKLWFYLRGFQDGIHSIEKKHGIESSTYPVYDGFFDYVLKHYRISSSLAWVHIILFMSMGSESKAFDTTKQLWYEYKAEIETQNDKEQHFK